VRIRQLFMAALAAGALWSAPAPLLAQTPDATYAAQAKSLWEQAEEAFKGGDYLEAVRLYNLVRTQFTYSSYVAMADLRIADAYFEQEKFATAVEQYRTFIKLHPNDAQTTYASWRIAFSFYRQMPDDWFFLPPSYERELARARDAERELRIFLKRFPDSRFTKEATRYHLLTRRRLADHELYVATFYMERGNSRAAAQRLTYLLQNYSGLGLDPNALFLLARAYVELGDVERALVALKDLIEVHPQHELSGKARGWLARHNLKLP
jgi:outer membrane protein assembly factor BamD